MSKAQFWAARGKRVMMEEEQELEPVREKRSLNDPDMPISAPYNREIRPDPAVFDTFWAARGKKGPVTARN